MKAGTAASRAPIFLADECRAESGWRTAFAVALLPSLAGLGSFQLDSTQHWRAGL